MCGVRGRNGKEKGGGNTQACQILCVVSSPNVLLKIFPLRACSLLNVVIMQNVLLPPSLPTADIDYCCRNIWEPGREPHTAVPIIVRGPLDNPSFPGLGAHSEYPWVPVAARLCLPSKSAGSSYLQKPLLGTSHSQQLASSSQCNLNQLFQPSSKTLENSGRHPWTRTRITWEL